MALRFIDSFDHYVTADGGSKWTAFGGTISAGNGRNGTQSWTAGASTTVSTLTLDSQSTWIVGLAIRTTAFSTTGGFLRFFDNGTAHLEFRYGAGATINVTRNGTLLGTGTTVLLQNVWYHLACKISISDTTGSITAYINGSPETFTWVTGNSTNQDTRNGANASANQIAIAGVASGTSVHIDDLYIMDTSGSVNNDIPTNPDLRVQTILPNGNGNSSHLVGSDGNSTDNYLLVDEATLSTADYVESGTAGNKDTYTYQDLSVSGTVYGVQIVPYASKSDAGYKTFAAVARLSGTEVDSASANVLSMTGRYFPEIRETKPGGGAWTVSDVNSAEFGVKVVA